MLYVSSSSSTWYSNLTVIWIMVCLFVFFLDWPMCVYDDAWWFVGRFMLFCVRCFWPQVILRIRIRHNISQNRPVRLYKILNVINIEHSMPFGENREDLDREWFWWLLWRWLILRILAKECIYIYERRLCMNI